MIDLSVDSSKRVWRRAVIGNALGAVAVVGLLTIPALALDRETFTAIFTEGGPVETASERAWLALAAVALATIRPTTVASLGGVLLCLAAAAREADWHKSFTGYSVMKIGFYFQAERTLGARALALVVMALVIASGVLVVRSVIAHWRESPENPPDWVVIACVSVGWLVATKVADRFRGVVGDFTGIEFGETTKTLLSAWEEGGELLLPPLFATAVWTFSRSGSPVPDRGRRLESG